MTGLKSIAAHDDIIGASGRNWIQWFAELQRDRFQGLSCDEVEDVLVQEYEIERNWARRITNRFAARHRFLENSGNKACFEVSVKRTFHYPVDRVFSSASHWFESENRAHLTEVMDGQQLLCKWNTDNSTVAVHFLNKGNGKTQLIVQHDQIKNQMDAEVMRNFWKENIKGMVEAF